MKTVTLEDVDLLDFGNEVQMWGVVFTGKGRTFIAPFPDQLCRELKENEAVLMRMEPEAFATLLQQLDVVNVQLANKAFVRKSQRRIDNAIAWAVYERDGYRCRYCGQKKPLTVDHVDLWEDGGATVPANLIAACGPCNKARGRMPYEEWLASKEYRSRSKLLSNQAQRLNALVVETLPFLRTLRQEVQRSR